MKTITKLKALYDEKEKECQEKGINNPMSLMQEILKDRERIAYEIYNLINIPVDTVLNSTFENDQKIIGQIKELTVNTNKLDHIGLAVMEPMDIALEGFRHWTDFFNQHFKTNISEDYLLRFSASEKFQQRVGGDVEIMRIALSDNSIEQSILLEIFDIRKKITDSEFGCDITTKSGFTSPKNASNPNEYFSAAKNNISNIKDNIRHYAITVLDIDSVQQVNQILLSFCDKNLRYSLTSLGVINNPNDGSHHIKIVKQNDGYLKEEVEFVAYEKDLSQKK